MAAVTSTRLPAPLRWAVVLILAEVVGAALVAGLLGYQGVTVAPPARGDTLAVAGFVLVYAAALAGLAAALHRRKARARAPAIVLQLLLVMLAIVTVTNGGSWSGVPVALVGVVVTTLLLTPASSAALA